MTRYILFICLTALFLVTCKKESCNAIKPSVVALPVKNNKINNTKRHPYFERYKKYSNDFSSVYSDYLKYKNNEGC
jgi:hypothetical protein